MLILVACLLAVLLPPVALISFDGCSDTIMQASSSTSDTVFHHQLSEDAMMVSGDLGKHARAYDLVATKVRVAVYHHQFAPGKGELSQLLCSVLGKYYGSLTSLRMPSRLSIELGSQLAITVSVHDYEIVTQAFNRRRRVAAKTFKVDVSHVHVRRCQSLSR